MDRDIFVVGSDFKEQTLIDKKVDIVFSNPPYSEYLDWAVKIITEANASIVYLVIPERWSSQDQIIEAVAARKGECGVIGKYDFLSADRRARAVVNVVRVKLGHISGHSSSCNIDPFDLWFATNFDIPTAQTQFWRRATSPLRWMGRLSYELYLFHIIVLGIMRSLVAPPSVTGDVKLLMLLIMIIASCVVSYMVARWFSNPLNKWFRRAYLAR